MNRRIDGGAGPQESGWNIPDEIEDPDIAIQSDEVTGDTDGFGADFERWMKSDDQEKMREMLEREDTPDFGGPLREESTTILERLRNTSLRGPILTAMIAMAAGGAVKAKDVAHALASGPETGVALVDTTVQAVEGEMTERKVKAFDAHFDRAAQELRASESIRAEFSPKDVERMATTLESFSSQDYFAFVADQAKMDVDDVARAWTLEGVHVYSGRNLSPSNFSDMVRVQAELNQEGVAEHLREIAELGATVQKDGGFHVDGHIFINTSMIAGMKVDPAEGLQNLLTHELAHGSGVGDAHDKITSSWKEGLVEMMANEYVAHWNGTSPAEADVISGYCNGPLAGVEMLSAALGDDAYLLRQAHVKGDWGPVSQQLESRYDLPTGWLQAAMSYDAGTDVFPDRFQSNIQTTRELNEQREFMDIQRQRQALQPLIVMAELAYDHPGIVDSANRDLSERAGKVSVISQEDVRGVALVSPLTETGFATGLVTVSSRDGQEVQIMLSQHVKDKPTVDVETPGGTVQVDFNFAQRYGEKSLLAATPAELSGALNQVIDIRSE